jgi:hypothetical protein
MFGVGIEAGDQIGQRQITVDVVAYLGRGGQPPKWCEAGLTTAPRCLRWQKWWRRKRLPQGRRESATNSSRLREAIPSMCSGRNNFPAEETILGELRRRPETNTRQPWMRWSTMESGHVGNLRHHLSRILQGASRRDAPGGWPLNMRKGNLSAVFFTAILMGLAIWATIGPPAIAHETGHQTEVLQARLEIDPTSEVLPHSVFIIHMEQRNGARTE